MKSNTKRQIFLLILLLAALPVAASGATGDPSPQERKAPPVSDRTTRQGVAVEFRATPSHGRSMNGEEIFAGDYVDLSFRLTDANTEAPLRGQFPGAWMDISESWDGAHSLGTSCKERVGTYLQGNVGIRPLLDLNSYFLLVMNRDPSISVIDPITGITGITKLYAQINLKSPGGDWAKTADDRQLFVTMPRIGELAVVDTDTFKVTDNVGAGENPTRIARQPDGQYLWVGNDAEDPAASGVTVIEVASLAVARRIATGGGHHELAFSTDSRYAFVTNRGDGTVSVIDVATLDKVKDLAIGALPISLDYSSSSQNLYVADAESGEIAVVDGRSLEVVTRIAARPGLGPLRFSQDGRWGVVVNTSEDLAHVFDPATNRIVHDVPVGAKPYQVVFSRSFAYVRSLATERVSMIDLSETGKQALPPVVTFGAGQQAPELTRNLSIADAIVEAPGEAAVMVVSPSDTTVYYYMEGMNAPMGNFRNYGHMPVAVEVVDRSLQEIEAGVYGATVRLPESGVYELAFLLDSPSILHCFRLAARPNPLLEVQGPALAVDFLDQDRLRSVGEPVAMRFKLSDPRTGAARSDLEDVSVYYFVAPGGKRTRVPAPHRGDGVYEASFTLDSSGAYYAYVACPSENVQPADLPFITFVARGGERPRPPSDAGSDHQARRRAMTRSQVQ